MVHEVFRTIQIYEKNEQITLNANQYHTAILINIHIVNFMNEIQSVSLKLSGRDFVTY